MTKNELSTFVLFNKEQAYDSYNIFTSPLRRFTFLLITQAI